MIYRGQPGESPFSDETVTDPPHDHPDQPAADHLPRGPGAELLERPDESGEQRPRRPPRQPGPRRGRQAAGQRDLALGTGQGAPACRSSPSFITSRGPSSRRSTWCAASACWPAGRGSTSPARPATSTPTTRPRAASRIQALEEYDIVCVHVEAPDEASHEGRHDAKVEALERIDRDIVGPLQAGLGVVRSVADPDLARSLDLAAHPGPRSRPGGLGHGRHRPAAHRAESTTSWPPRMHAAPISTRAIA